MSDYNLKKTKLFEAFKEETEKQLKLIQDEDAEGFLVSVEKCEQLIEWIEELDELHHPDAVSTKSQPESLQQMIRETLELREQISKLVPIFQQKIQQFIQNEQKKHTLQKGYGKKEPYSSSVFFDQKK